ncbi:MAG: hypothetical protein AABX54_01710 [Nanoarchaeota archaeon]
MGKNKAIQSLGKVIGNVVVHKVVLKYGKKMESENHTSSEIVAYRNTAISIGMEFNWNDNDKIEIRKEVHDFFIKKMNEKYSHIKYPGKEAENIINETIKECL